MDAVRFGTVIRALRRRRSWRQVDLAASAGVSQDLISVIERGHADGVVVATVWRVAAALDARAGFELRWRGGELDRLLDASHAAVCGAIAGRLTSHGWDVRVEVTYSIFGAHGSIDVLAWHAATATLLVIEVKTEITSAESTIRKLDEKVRLAPKIVAERFGWRPTCVARLLAVESTRTNRRRVDVAGGLFDVAFPDRGVAVRRWLRNPVGARSGLLFVSDTSRGRAMRNPGGRHRVAKRQPAGRGSMVSVERHEIEVGSGDRGPSLLTNRTLHDR